jgi:hypothetical protein
MFFLLGSYRADSKPFLNAYQHQAQTKNLLQQNFMQIQIRCPVSIDLLILDGKM